MISRGKPLEISSSNLNPCGAPREMNSIRFGMFRNIPKPCCTHKDSSTTMHSGISLLFQSLISSYSSCSFIMADIAY